MLYIWQLTCKPAFLIGWFFRELFSNAQTNLWHLNVFSLATTTAACKCSSRCKWLRGLVQSINFWDTSFGIDPYRAAIIQKVSLLSWPLVFRRHFSFNILNTKFCMKKHNIGPLDKDLEFFCIKSEHILVKDSVCKMITLLDLIKFYRTPNSS